MKNIISSSARLLVILLVCAMACLSCSTGKNSTRNMGGKTLADSLNAATADSAKLLPKQ